MLANVVAYVPRILLSEQTNGMVMGIILSTVIGTVLMYWFLYQLKKFPAQGMPDLVERYTPRWFNGLFSLLNGVMWFMAGLITLIVFVDISTRFINPEMGSNVTIFMFLLVICAGVLLDSKSLLFVLEIVLIINIPLMIMIFLKAYVHDYFNWDYVRIVFTHFWELPSWTTLSAGLYIFLGFLNLNVFNKYITKLQLKWLWIVPLAGLFTLFTTVAVPIGLNGLEMSKTYSFPWISTVDSMRIEFGVIERVLFIFLVLYIGISLLSIMIHWHVSLKWIEKLIPKMTKKKINITPFIIIIGFAGVSVLIQYLTNERTILFTASRWFDSLIPAILCMNFMLFWLIRRLNK